MSEKITTKANWEKWAIKLQSLAQAGLFYTDNEFERERYREIRKIACEILAEHSTVDIDKVTEYFTPEVGYQTPKLDSRSVCFKDDKILLVQETSGGWALPGGWVDVDQTLSQNIIKEAKEEAGADVKPKFIICIQDWKTHTPKRLETLPYQICKIFVMCDLLDVNFQQNSETLQSDFFELNNLPELLIGKNTKEQIEICFKAKNACDKGEAWIPVFD